MFNKKIFIILGVLLLSIAAIFVAFYFLKWWPFAANNSSDERGKVDIKKQENVLEAQENNKCGNNVCEESEKDCPVDCLGSKNASKIKVILNLHIDPTNEILYPGHRDAFLWLQELAKEKGFEITAEAGGDYAEMAIKKGNIKDFADFMPGKQHMLGMHFHSYFKSSDGKWQEDLSATTNFNESLTQKIFNDNVQWVNKIFTGLGYKETDNHLFHETQAQTNGILAKFLGLQKPNNNTYPNVFDITGDARLFHPYRNFYSLTGGEGGGPVSSIAMPTAGTLFGANAVHGPEGMVYGAVSYQERYFIMEYLEWWYAQKKGLSKETEKPWMFAIDLHPYNVDISKYQYPGVNGQDQRSQLVQFYDWLNKYFGEAVIQYATSGEAADAFRAWEAQHPKELMYEDNDPNIPGVQTALLTQTIANAVNDENFYMSNLELAGDTIMASMQNDKKKALLVIPGNSKNIDLTKYITGQVKMVSAQGSSIIESINNIKIASEPLLLVAQ